MDEDEIDFSKAETFVHPLIPEWWKSDKLWVYLKLRYNIERDGLIDDEKGLMLCIKNGRPRLRDWR